MNYLAVVNRLFLDSPSGSARVAWDIAVAMRDAGHRVALLCCLPDKPTDASTLEQIQGITVVRYGTPAGRWSGARTRQHEHGAALALRNRLQDFAPDVVHIHSLLPGWGVLSALGPNFNYVATIHSPVVEEQAVNWRAQGVLGACKRLLGGLRVLRSIQQRLLTSATRVHVLSDFTRKRLEYHHGRLPPCQVIPHWRGGRFVRTLTQTEARQRLGLPPSARILFSARRLVPRMGHDLAIQALAPLLAEYDALLLFAGAGPQLARLQGMARQSLSSDRIRFLGRVSDEELILLYQAADVFVLPTLALECFGLIILEALGMGCPVLGTRVGAVPEILMPILPEWLVDEPFGERLRAKAREVLTGDLRAEPNRLATFVEQNYGESAIRPRVLDFITGATVGGV